MTRKTQQKEGQNDRVKASNVYPKISKTNSTVNRANIQSRPSGILCAPAHGKLYFGATGIFPSYQNHLPRAGRNVLRSRTFIQKTFTLKTHTVWQRKTD
jgi:hypothetical protein